MALSPGGFCANVTVKARPFCPLGLGVLAANTLGPWLIQSVFTAAGVTNFRSLFLLPCLTALVAAIVLAVAFRPPAQAETEAATVAESEL